ALSSDTTLTFFFSSSRRHTRSKRDWSSDVCSSDLIQDKCRYTPVLFLRVCAGPGQQKAFISQMAKTGPNLLPVDQPTVSFFLSSRLNCCQIRSRIRF